MTADRIATAFRQAATQLNFEFQTGFALSLPDGSIVESVGRLPFFGSARGTLVFAEQASPVPVSLRALEEMGYFTSLLFASYERFDEPMSQGSRLGSRHNSARIDSVGQAADEPAGVDRGGRCCSVSGSGRPGTASR